MIQLGFYTPYKKYKHVRLEFVVNPPLSSRMNEYLLGALELYLNTVTAMSRKYR
ncbi:hypothetical protein WN55_08960 [Dufourea novaeangliae]|uniref:Uncharacterized protein n=1 Tax=Dufourea novaeangliae TaxID=178035 RepID=A0A154P686_DUFNO|nr:hypothetical protein WN55_08960 [Dufourea novaeangliae]